MCGIVCAFNIKGDKEVVRANVLKMAQRVRHRGPDWSGIYSDDHAILAHERLAIVDPTSGKQPIISQDGNKIIAVNGEIYNHQILRESLASYNFKTQSDCEVIIPLYESKGVNFLNDLNGIFAFALYDSSKDTYLIARDHIGIIPLYMGWDNKNIFYVSSELKSLEGVCDKIELFPPGHYLESHDMKLKEWYKPEWTSFDSVKNAKTSISSIHDSLSAAVKRQLMSDVPLWCFAFRRT